MDPLAGSRRSESGWEKGGATAAAPARPPLPIALPRDEAASGGRTLADIRLENVSRTFVIDGQALPVLDGVSFEVPERGVTCVLGPNGSGKSTLLRLLAGLLVPDRGTIRIAGEPVRDADARVGLVFQEPRLLPWRRALDNVAFPLELAGVRRAARHERALELLAMVNLEGFGAAYPHQMSGGMRQRLAIARALATDPAILLLDEPFSALDALTRERFNEELLDLWQRTATTIVIVTHSIAEAVFLADEVVVLSARPGRVVARVPVPIARPRAPGVMESAAFARAAAQVRAHLAGTPQDYAAQEAAAAPIHDVLERAGVPAWFDPFRSEP